MKRVSSIVLIMMVAGLAFGGLPVRAQVEEPASTPLSYGQTVQDTISNDRYEHRYWFEGSRGERVYLSAYDLGSGLRIDIALQDAQGRVLLQALEGYGSGPLVLGPFELPQDGSYTIVMGRYDGKNGTSTGNYLLTLDLVQEALLAPGEDIAGTLDRALATHFWEFIAEEKTVISLRTSGEGLRYVLIGPDQQEITSAGFSTDPLATFVLLPYAGVYRLSLQTQNFQGSAYALRVEIHAITEIVAETPFQDTIGASRRSAYYQVYPPQVDLLRVEVVSADADFAGSVSVYNMAGDRVASASSSDEPDYDLLIEPWVVAQDSYYYYLVVSAAAKVDEDVSFEIAVRPSQLTLLTLGEAVTMPLNRSATKQRYVLEVAAGLSADLSLRPIDGWCTPELHIGPRWTGPFNLETNTIASALTAALRFTETGYLVFEVEVGYGEECVVELLIAPGE
ncbi:MAG: hypothetical protein AB1435_02640 [Chloroflexota bacterium]|jgi:hypothetical protein